MSKKSFILFGFILIKFALQFILISAKYVIRVKENDDENELQETAPYFNTATLSDSIANPYAREYKTLIFAFTGAKIDISKRLKKEIEEVKSY